MSRSVSLNSRGTCGVYATRGGTKNAAGGMAYNVSGNRGVKLRLADGKSLLIGSQRPEEFLLALQTRTEAK